MRHIFLLAFVVACSSPPITPPPTIVKTAAMAANITVSADGTTTKASIVLLTGDTLMARVDLGTGDTLTTTGKGMSKPMTATGMGPTLAYEASFDGSDIEGSVYTIALARTADVGAPNSTATLPAPLTLMKPVDGASFSRLMDDIVVTYAPNNTTDPITWSIEGTCVKATGMQPVTGDSGSFTIGRGGLKDAGGGSTCDAVLTVYRNRPGTLDPAFARGIKVNAQQLGRVSISLRP
jgi:hypothetical protein